MYNIVVLMKMQQVQHSLSFLGCLSSCFSQCLPFAEFAMREKCGMFRMLYAPRRPMTAPRRPQTTPRWFQDGPRQDPKMAPRRPQTRPQDGSKSAWRVGGGGEARWVSQHFYLRHDASSLCKAATPAPRRTFCMATDSIVLGCFERPHIILRIPM